MQNNPEAFQDAVARAREIAQKLTASAPNSGFNNSFKRSNNDDDYSNKRPAFSSSSSQNNETISPVLRAQQIAQQINSQLGVKSGNEGALVPLSNQLTSQEDFKIPDKYVGLIIGKGGEQIIRLQAESGCKIAISQVRHEPTSGDMSTPDRIASLSGSRDSIERAKRVMEDIINRGRAADSGSNSSNPYSMGGSGGKSSDVMLPSAKCGLIIGKGGENIKRISDEFNVRLFIVQEPFDLDGIEHKPLRITGDGDRVERARQYILDFLSKPGPSSGGGGGGNRFNSNQGNNSAPNDYGSRNDGPPSTNGPCNEATYLVPHDRAGIIIGKGGESIKEINRKSAGFVELDKNYVPSVGNSADRLFRLRGTPEQIVIAQQYMYEKVANSPSGPGDMETPLQFQQRFNLPLVGTNPVETWTGSADPYAAAMNGSDPYSQWASAYGQWPQMNPYGDAASKGGDAAATGMEQMDPAWLAYYQSMNYYNMMQSNVTGGASSGAATGTTTSQATDSTANSTSATAAAGQADYSQQWIEYYRSLGQNDVADEIVRQMKETGKSTGAADPSAAAAAMMMSGDNPWAAYAQQWINGAGAAAAAANTSNGTGASTTSSSS